MTGRNKGKSRKGPDIDYGRQRVERASWSNGLELPGKVGYHWRSVVVECDSMLPLNQGYDYGQGSLGCIKRHSKAAQAHADISHDYARC